MRYAMQVQRLASCFAPRIVGESIVSVCAVSAQTSGK
jgi:hypothetical protein